MNILHENTSKNGAFYVEENGNRLAQMTYVWAGENKFIIDHTEVSEALRGKNAGKQLVAAAVAFARKNGYTILPLCPFAKSVFEKVKDYQDVLA
jgi:hypothetical protein